MCYLRWTYVLKSNRSEIHYKEGKVNLSPLNAAYMCQWTVSALVQIMACRLFDAKPSPEPMPTYCQLDFRNKLQWNLNQNAKLFIQEMHLKMWSARWLLLCTGRSFNNNTVHDSQLALSAETNARYNIFKHIFFTENVGILIKISLKFVPKGPINNILALVQITAWHQSDNKP